MDFKKFVIVFQERIEQVKKMVELTNKSSVLVIQQFPLNTDTEILAPNVRESISNIIAFVELGDIQTMGHVIEKSDGAFDVIVLDIDIKLEQSVELIDMVKKRVKHSRLFYYNDTSIWVDSGVNYIQRIENGLFEKNVLVTGSGFLFYHLILKLCECGALVYAKTENNRFSLNLLFSVENPHGNFRIIEDNFDYSKIDLVVGGECKRPSLELSILDSFKDNIRLYDIGIGNFTEKVLDAARLKNLSVFRLDNRAGISGMILNLFETDFLITKMMGKVIIKDIEIVAGGVMGQNGAIIVDNINDPSYIIGIADGKGNVKPGIETDKELSNIEFVNKIIRKI